MIPSELNMICRWAAAMGPFGSRTPSEQPPSVAMLIRATARTLYRMSDLVCPDRVESKRSGRVVVVGIRLERIQALAGGFPENSRCQSRSMGLARRLRAPGLANRDNQADR